MVGSVTSTLRMGRQSRREEEAAKRSVCQALFVTSVDAAIRNYTTVHLFRQISR